MHVANSGLRRIACDFLTSRNRVGASTESPRTNVRGNFLLLNARRKTFLRRKLNKRQIMSTARGEYPVSGAEAVYHFCPRRGSILLVFICGLPFAVITILTPWEAGPRHFGWWMGFPMAGAAAYCYVLAPVVLLTTAVTVGPAGLTKAPRWNWGFSVEWTRVDSWSVGRPPAWHDADAHERVVRFRVAGWRREMIVFDSEVGHPGFATFVAALREAAGDREMVTPNLALQQTVEHNRITRF